MMPLKEEEERQREEGRWSLDEGVMPPHPSPAKEDPEAGRGRKASALEPPGGE